MSSSGIEKYASAMKKSEMYWYRMSRSSAGHCGSTQLQDSISPAFQSLLFNPPQTPPQFLLFLCHASAAIAKTSIDKFFAQNLPTLAAILVNSVRATRSQSSKTM
jgi:hypothetical protein